MSKIIYLHGFNSSPRSFNYVIKSLPQHEPICIAYDSHRPLSESLGSVLKQLPKDEIVLIGHSLGGVIAALAAAARPETVRSLVTVSAPLGGSKACQALRWLPGHPPVVEDLTFTSPHIRAIASLKLQVPTISIVSTGGHLSFSAEPNDSIVTVASQRALSFGRKHEIKANHFEILLHDRTVELIERHTLP